MPLPVILLTFAGPGDRPLPELDAEASSIWQALEALDDEQYRVKNFQRVTFDLLVRSLRKYGPELSIFHFAGHANGEELAILNRAGEAHPLFRRNFVHILRANARPDLVFLNGCTTWEYADQLINAGVPHVIATSTEIPDVIAAHYARIFYEEFATGKDFREAFSLTQELLQSAEFVEEEAKEARSLLSRKIDFNQPDQLPWRFYDEQHILRRLIRKELDSEWKGYEGGKKEGLVELYQKGEAKSKQGNAWENWLGDWCRRRTGKHLCFRVVFLPPGSSKANGPDSVSIPLSNTGIEDLEALRESFRQATYPSLLVLIEFSKGGAEPKVFWTDLEPANADWGGEEGEKELRIFNKARLNRHSKQSLLDRYGLYQGEVDWETLPRIRLERAEVLYLNTLSRPLKKLARSFYQQWAQSSPAERTHPQLGEIAVSRVGWRHLNRRRRKTEHTIQSWFLLAAARRMLREVPEAYLLRTLPPKEDAHHLRTLDYLGLRAWVSFPYRGSSLLQVVLKRCRDHDKSTGETQEKTWFLSVYELNRDDGGMIKAKLT
jgi:hypothetical protein